MTDRLFGNSIVIFDYSLHVICNFYYVLYIFNIEYANLDKNILYLIVINRKFKTLF